MTIEEISVKFTADTNELKKALSDITETLKGTEAQTMDIASALDEITQPIKDMSKTSGRSQSRVLHITSRCQRLRRLLAEQARRLVR